MSPTVVKAVLEPMGDDEETPTLNTKHIHVV